MPTGTVKWFNNAKGWGFITTSDGTDAFVHYGDITGDGFKTLEAGDTVEFEMSDGPKGAKAINVHKA
ncbi:MAG TPA: cold shock domain-containing protein [Phycisphaerae bacterium]|nr:cold shock domain-containing protein [Phycisphaerae bacterium]